MIKDDGIPGYLKKRWKESRWNRLTKFRLGNVMREGGFWGDDEDKCCRRCGWEVESWEHVWEECGS